MSYCAPGMSWQLAWCCKDCITFLQGTVSAGIAADTSCSVLPAGTHLLGTSFLPCAPAGTFLLDAVERQLCIPFFPQLTTSISTVGRFFSKKSTVCQCSPPYQGISSVGGTAAAALHRYINGSENSTNVLKHRSSTIRSIPWHTMLLYQLMGGMIVQHGQSGSS